MGALGWISTAIGVLSLLGLVGAGVRWLYVRVLHPLTLLIEDWSGRPGRPGVPAVPSVMERFQASDERQAAMMRTLERVDVRVRDLEQWREELEELRRVHAENR